MKYAVVIEKGEGNFSAYVPDLPGCVAAADSFEETERLIRDAIEMLPPMQAEVIRLRDVLGWSSEDVRNALEISETNQRVLLHRARSKVRSALERHFMEGARA